MIKIEKFRKYGYSIEDTRDPTGEGLLVLVPDEVIELYGLLGPVAAEIMNERARENMPEPKKTELE